jgi:hypothetical protein
LDKRVKKAKAIAYLVSVAIQVIGNVEVQEEINSMKKELEIIREGGNGDDRGKKRTSYFTKNA